MRGLISKPGTLNVSRQNCYLVGVRNMNPASGDRLGKWEPISVRGFKVVCPSKKEAVELMLMVGGILFPWPGAALNDEQYEAWLLDNHFKIEHYVATGRFEIMFAEFVKGWTPDLAEMESGNANAASEFAAMLAAYMRD